MASSSSSSNSDRQQPSLFRYFSRSKDAAPGCGVGERLRPGDDFQDIAFTNFRQKLSNFYPCNFVDDEGLPWPSVEHYFHGYKVHVVSGEDIRIINRRIKRLSTLDAKRSTGKRKLHLTKDQLRRWDSVKRNVIKKALRCKFNMLEYRDLLLNTKDAVLSHVSRGYQGDAFAGGALLMELRAELRRRDSCCRDKKLKPLGSEKEGGAASSRLQSEEKAGGGGRKSERISLLEHNMSRTKRRKIITSSST